MKRNTNRRRPTTGHAPSCKSRPGRHPSCPCTRTASNIHDLNPNAQGAYAAHVRKAVTIWVLLLAAPTCAATQSFSASSIDFDWASLDAAPSVLVFREAGALSMEAKAVRMETETLRTAQVGPAGAIVTIPPTTTSTQHSASSWHAKDTGSPQSLFIDPKEARTSTLQGHGTALVPASDCVQQPNFYTSPRQLLCPSVNQSVQVKATASQWVITGNFTLILWSWQGTVVEGANVTEFWSGSRPTADTFGIGEYEYRQIFLDVTEGTLWLRPAEGRFLELYSPGITAVVEQATIHGQAGTVHLSKYTTQNRMEVSRAPAGLQGSFDPIQAPAQAVVAMPDWPIGALGAALLLAPIGLTLVRSNQGLRHLSLASDNLELENHRAAARHANKAARIRRLRSRAGLLGAVACIRYGDLAGAEHFIKRMHASIPHDEAGCRFLLAHVRIEQGRREEGQVLLEECLSINPSYVEEAAGSPVLGPFVDPLKWPRGA